MNWREGHSFQIGGPAVSINSGPAQLFGWDWQNLSTGNVPLETLVLENQSLIYETIDYTRWADFSARFENVALPVLEEVLRLVDISNLVLEYVDRFVFEGPAAEARADGVLSEAFVSLPEAARTGPAAWHSHLGWFEEIEGHSMLVNQNVDAQDGSFQVDGPAVRSLQVYTKTDLRPRDYENGYEGLRPAMNAMHVKSKQLVYDILTPDMRQRIGMEGS
ncbi:TIGR04255 family protein [Algirhabdus cladophorae]|uniref:TIGR04255 family protein n=1 Tax=Algirhabdus cladophorae TaxID=3377108 RepID=UPI003B8485ED